MLIKELKFYVAEGAPATRQATNRDRGTMMKVPPGLSGLFTHAEGVRGRAPDDEYCEFPPEPEAPTYDATLRLVTDGGLDAYAPFGTGFSCSELEWECKDFKARIGPLIVGIDAFDREHIWQKLWYAQRFFYTGRRPIDLIDRMLWDLASRHANLPIYKLLGACREEIPAYRNIGGNTIDDLVADGLRARAEGYVGCKDHSYRGVKGNAEMARALRAALGDDFKLMHDPVESYTCLEAIKIGRVLEECNYEWIEEPLQDYDLMGLKKLSDALDLPVMALEWIGAVGGEPFNASAFLALQAIDIVRQRGHGITGSIKLSQMVEGFGLQVHGGDPHVALAVGHDPLHETVGGLKPRPPEEELDCLGTLVVENGAMSIAWAPRRPQEPDWDQRARGALAVI